jgi:hypothetical protein
MTAPRLLLLIVLLTAEFRRIISSTYRPELEDVCSEGSSLSEESSYYRPVVEEPDFAIPKHLSPGEMVRVQWRSTMTPVDSQARIIGLPPELSDELQAYIEHSGLMDVARKSLYEEDPRKWEHEASRLHTLKDGRKWSAMNSNWDSDMIWMDPADEECFEYLLAMLGRGGFDIVLDQIGKHFQLESLMIGGIGTTILSDYKYTGVRTRVHTDMDGVPRTFFNLIFPVHIPENRTAPLYLGNENSTTIGSTNLQRNVGVLLDGETPHGTGVVDYKKDKDFRVAFAVWMADINEENVDIISNDSTALWPPEGDKAWFWAQRGRVWSKDGMRSLKNDQGRKPLKVVDTVDGCRKDKCEGENLEQIRRNCAKTCRVYLDDEEYYSLISSQRKSDERAG